MHGGLVHLRNVEPSGFIQFYLAYIPIADNLSILGDLPPLIPVLEEGKVMCLLLTLDLWP